MMKKLKQFALILGFVALSGYSYGQYDMELCKRIIETEVDLKACRTVSVITDVVGTSQIAANHITFDNQSVTFDYTEKYIKVSDSTGKFFYITYDKIKAISFVPETSRAFSSFSIYLNN